jgi:putative ABC transport system permease protein
VNGALSEGLVPGTAGLILAGLLMVAVVAVAFASGVNMIRQGLVATARTTLQLLAVGFLLHWVFARNTWLVIIGLLLMMSLVAGWTGSGRVERALRGTGPALTLILVVVLAVTLLYVTQLAVGVHRAEARYFVSLGGMILGNAMTAGSLAAQRFHDELRGQRERVEAALALGASPAQATRRAWQRSFFAALTPTLNAMMIVGIVKLPGIMTGQMLAGSSPFDAAKYQILVMFMLAFGDGMTALAMLGFLRRQAFTRAWQPRL